MALSRCQQFRKAKDRKTLLFLVSSLVAYFNSLMTKASTLQTEYKINRVVYRKVSSHQRISKM